MNIFFLLASSPMPLVLYDKISKSTITFYEIKLLLKRHPLHNISIIFTNFRPPHKSHPPPAYFGCRHNISPQANLKLFEFLCSPSFSLVAKLRQFITGRNKLSFQGCIAILLQFLTQGHCIEILVENVTIWLLSDSICQSSGKGFFTPYSQALPILPKRLFHHWSLDTGPYETKNDRSLSDH